MKLPKIRELKEAITAVFSPRFTTRFPKVPCKVPERYRGKPEFDQDFCIGCGACVNVCPTEALTMVDDPKAQPPVRVIKQRYDTCIFCGNCQENCTTEKGIKLSNKWDLATLDRNQTFENHQHELQLCEKCGEIIGTKKHLIWLYDRLGPLAYTNPSLLLAKSDSLAPAQQPNIPLPTGMLRSKDQPGPETADFMRVLCPNCKCELNIRL